jgi:5-methyltetrahydrofolate--homocysteine methyltransferase
VTGDGINTATVTGSAALRPAKALRGLVLRQQREGVEASVDHTVAELGVARTLHDVLLPAMAAVDRRFAAGELILPQLLAAAEVAQRAIAQLKCHDDALASQMKGTIVVASVSGDVHDIGKSLMAAVLRANGYVVIDLGRKVPASAIVTAAVDHEASAIALSALLTSTSKQMSTVIAELHARGLELPVLIGGPLVTRKFALRLMLLPDAGADAVYEPGVFFCKDGFDALATLQRLSVPGARRKLVHETAVDARALHDEPPSAVKAAPGPQRSGARSAARTDLPLPVPPYWGVRELEVGLDELVPHIARHGLFKMSWGGHGVKGEKWERLVRDEFEPRLQRMWRQASYLKPRALLGFFPCNGDGEQLIVWDPQDFDPAHPRELERLSFPRQPGCDRLCLADFFRPLQPGAAGAVDVVELQAATVGPGVSAEANRLESEGELAEQFFVRGLGVYAALATTRWLRAKALADLGLPADRGHAYAWGYPACPDLSEQSKVFRLLRPESIGLRLTEGFSLDPEQSTVSLMVHHPQAGYFGMGSGRLAR